MKLWVLRVVLCGSLWLVGGFACATEVFEVSNALDGRTFEKVRAFKSIDGFQPSAPIGKAFDQVTILLHIEDFQPKTHVKKALKKRKLTPIKREEGKAVRRENIILHMTVNGVDRGDQFCWVDGTDEVWLSIETIKELGITGFPNSRGEDPDADISLLDFSQDISYQLNKEIGELALSVNPDWLPEQKIQLTTPTHFNASVVSDNAIFLNYSASNGWTDQGGSNAFSLPMELGMHIGEWLFTTNGQYKNSGSRWTRAHSQLLRDDDEKMIRYRVGDISAVAGSSGIGATLGGLSIARNFNLQPNLIRTPDVSFNLIVPTASEVDIYVDGNLVRTDHVMPGPLTITDPPFIGGLSNVEVVIRDAFGREERHQFSHYYASSLLEKGLTDFITASVCRKW